MVDLIKITKTHRKWYKNIRNIIQYQYEVDKQYCGFDSAFLMLNAQ